MSDMNEFLELAHRAGLGSLNGLETAEALEISTSYVAKLRSGTDPVTSNIRAKLDALIAAKGDGPVIEGNTIRQTMKLKSDFKPVEQVEVDLPGPDLAKEYPVEQIPANGVSRFNEPVDLSDYSATDRFAVIDAQDGTAVLVEIIEPFNNHTAARKICALLNKERD